MDRRNILKYFGYSAVASAISEPLSNSLISETGQLAGVAASSAPGAAFNQVGFLPDGVVATDQQPVLEVGDFGLQLRRGPLAGASRGGD